MTKTEKTGPSPRETALLILYQVAEKGAFANLELNKVLNRGTYRGLDRSFITELVYGTIRMQGRIDYILGLFIKKPLNTLPLWILLILRLGVYQIMFLDKVPERAAVNESVKLAKKYGHAGTVKLVNGVLRNITRQKDQIVYPSLEQDPVNHIALLYSHPQWMVEGWLEQFGREETLELCAWNNTSPQVTLRTNTLKTTREGLLLRLKEEGVASRPGRFVPESIILEEVTAIASLPSYQEGLFQVQDEGSMLVAHVLQPSPGSRMLDLCAAPGGKTTHVAQLMKNQGEIKAFDLYPHKLSLIDESCKRLGITIVETAVQDGTQLPDSLTHWADYCLVDAPCSGLGVLRRRPDARWNKEKGDIGALAAIQKKLLSAAAKTVKPGGILVYSTCTITPEENEALVCWFLREHEDFALDPIDQILGFPLGDLGDHEKPSQGMLQLYPHRHGTDGLFMARMKKRHEVK
ncbi:16S rRNA (cytosine(967)-C(5))-methyltransferase RsmB [Dehalobacterium formicoaceticum]|uniref:16S rRNA (cytosine(967)-C(5))-methyltransferase n=1 Tax=Dehalobacterium formicoaceticum TaxID=51515 RepID=A0ABT1Y1A5_9FIRM|nr:16S rRNA (cytosine(967)-C(5))-methyltransferase RsmB [Dehalobacterium formicoaceticum]MCR6544641.1 16S rRNA (cytosine(967)-C(5))-methyltransferase RsmB [Dehalobacterium formicoaceticum]